MDRHSLLTGGGQVADLKLGAIVSIPDLVSEMFALIRSRTGSPNRKPSVSWMAIVRRAAEQFSGANPE